MRTRALPSTAVVLLIAVTGCSFRGSLGEPSAASSASASAASSAGTTSESPSTAPAGASSSPTTSSASGLPGRCRSTELSARLVPGSPGAGQRYADLVLTNTGSTTCTILGYGGIGLVDAKGAALPTKQVRVDPPAPHRVTLGPQQAAHSQLHFSAIPGTGDAQGADCQPTPASLRVIPPDETTSIAVPWTQGPVCEQGTIDQQPYTAG
jgi:Protein of unknown function (DUF4232)